MNGSGGSDDDAASANVQQSILKEAYCGAVNSAVFLQSILDGMDEALVAEVRKSIFCRSSMLSLVCRCAGRTSEAEKQCLQNSQNKSTQKCRWQ